MDFQVKVHHGPFLLIVATGEAQVCDLLGGIELLRVVAHERGYDRALLDLLGTQPQLSFTEHFRVGKALAESMKGIERVASVVPAAYRVGVSEKAAKLSGLALQTFTDLPSAIEWLTTGDKH